MRRSLAFLTLLLVFSASSALVYEVEGVKTRVFPEEVLEYSVNITNDEASTKQVYINKFVIESTFGKAVSVKPSINLILQPNQSEVISLTVPVSAEMVKGVYRTPLIVSFDNVTDRVFIDSVILSRVVEPIELQNISVITPASVIPLNDFNITVTLLVNVESVYPLIKVFVSGDSGIIYESSSVQGLVEGINIFNRGVKLPDNTLPGVYDVLVEAELTGKLITQGVADLLVNPYTLTSVEDNAQEDLFGKDLSRVISNDGTETINVSVNYTASIIEPLLVSKALLNIREDGVVVSSRVVDLSNYVVDELVTLAPGQSAELVLEFNYAGLLLIPFIVIISVLAWFFITKRVIVEKEILECRREGDEIVVKVGISVKNVSLKSIRDVRIVEDLPIYAKKAGGFGSIRGEIDREKGIINFDAGRLDPKEEVMISYKFKTDVELIGKVRLPPVTIKYKSGGKLMISKSDTPIIHLIKGGQ